MTPAELDAVRRLVREAVKETVALALQPIQEQVDGLTNTDKRHDADLRKHSGTHKDIVANVRKSESDIKAVTNETILAAQARLDERLEAFQEEMRRSIPAAAKGAEAAAVAGAHAATDAKNATTDLAISAVKTQATVRGNRLDSRIGTAITVIVMIAFEVVRQLSKGHP